MVVSVHSLSLREAESEKFRLVVVGLGCIMRACLSINTHHNLAGPQAVRSAHTRHAQSAAHILGMHSPQGTHSARTVQSQGTHSACTVPGVKLRHGRRNYQTFLTCSLFDYC